MQIRVTQITRTTHEHYLLDVQEERAHSKELHGKKEEPKQEVAANKDKDKGKKTGPTSPFKIPPKDNEPKSKKIGNVDTSWCSRCERWTKGEKCHLTKQHKTKAELQAAQVNVTSSILPNSGLQMSHFH